jgi:hypothetical protein
MQPRDSPEARLVNLWPQLGRHLEWSSGFILFYLFGDQSPAVAELRKSLADQCAIRAAPLEIIDDDTAEDWLTQGMAAALKDDPMAREARSPLWLEAYRYPQDETWNRVRAELLGRLNERRYRLEQKVARPLLLVLPTQIRSTVAERGPDLWSVREATFDISASDTTPNVDLCRLDTDAMRTTRPLSPEAQARLDDWKRVQAVANIARVSPQEGWDAYEAVFDFDLDLAQAIAVDTLALAT